jgi:hypothetical protein
VHIDGGSETANAFPLRYNSFINHGLELGAAFKF